MVVIKSKLCTYNIYIYHNIYIYVYVRVDTVLYAHVTNCIYSTSYLLQLTLSGNPGSASHHWDFFDSILPQLMVIMQG